MSKQLCENCGYEYNTEDIGFKKDFLKKQGKEDFCNNCLAETDFQEESLEEDGY